ncbi:MAG TPA: hypothetical protein VE618_06905 [Myxococcaceae bacterium]|nr:hypothetical protein [Myxococcaceae bacterium]
MATGSEKITRSEVVVRRNAVRTVGGTASVTQEPFWQVSPGAHSNAAPHGLQVPLWQTPDWQSLAAEQVWPLAHAPHVDPPQSTAVSAPLSTPSLQEGAWQAPPMHTPLWQSAPEPQPSPAGHGPHVAPQSTSVSVPFCTPSLQADAWHTFPAQTLLWQSALEAQPRPASHAAQSLPPQSTSVSAPLRTPSVHACD